MVITACIGGKYMDLRIQRTKTAIRNSFIALRKKKPIEKITVTELSGLAGINKATFYLHYSDIYALSDEIEDGVIDEIILGLKVLDSFFDAPKEFSMEIFKAFMDNRKRLETVFSGSRYSGFAIKIERRIKAIMYEKYPDFYTKENDIIVSFFIQGIFHTVAECREDSQEVYDVISELASSVLTHLRLSRGTGTKD